jgi:hypothetical protein
MSYASQTGTTVTHYSDNRTDTAPLWKHEANESHLCEFCKKEGISRREYSTRIHNADEETHVNAAGGAQSKLPIRPRLIPPEALIRLGEVVAFGAGKYAENNWRRIPYQDHIDHALYHLFSLLDGDTTDDHLGHALTRLAFAVAMEPASYEFGRIVGSQQIVEGVTLPFDFKQYRDLPEKENNNG